MTVFSLSPTHFEVRDDALILKNVLLHSVAIALAIIVLPVPGGPNINIPRCGLRIPVKRSGRIVGTTIISYKVCFISSIPIISLNLTLGFFTIISDSTF